MRRTVETTGAKDGWMRRAAVAALAAGLAMAWGCESATQSNLSEYEKLVARRRSESLAARQQPAQAQAGAAAAAAADRAAAERAAAEKAAAEKAAAKKAEADRLAAEKAAKKAAEQKAAEEKAAAKRAAEERAAAEKAEKVAREAAEREAAERAAREEAERAAAAVAVVAPPAAQPAPATDVRGAGDSGTAGVYRLAKGDIVQIALRGIPESQQIDDSLDEFGMISLPFLNEVYAEGLTASELEQRIRNMYRDAQIYPNVTVQVQVPTRYYFMLGEIRGPGRVQMITATRLSQAIAAAGGGTEFWNGKVLLRRNGTIFREIKNAKRLEKTPEDDVLLEPGDIVELKRSFL